MPERVSFEIVKPEVIAEKFDDEYVIVNLKSGSYYGLRGSGAPIWEMVVGGATRAEIVAGLAEQFEADPTVLDGAVAVLLLELQQENLITPSSTPALDAPTGSTPTARPAVRPPFVAPILEKHGDMQEVLQLDPIHEVDENGWPSRKVEE